MKKHRTASQLYHDRVAGQYDEIYENEPYWLFYDEVTWQHMKKYLPKDINTPIFDIGCGTGKWGLRLAKSGYPVTLADNSVKMLDQARRKAELLPGPPKVSFETSDITDLKEFDDESFGFVVSQGDPMSLVENPRKAAATLFRVLRRDGIAVCSLDNRWAGIDHHVEMNDIDLLEKFLRDGNTHWFTKCEKERYHVHMFWPEEIAKLFEQVGFQMLSMIAKTSLIRRRDSKLLESTENRRKLVKLELRYGKTLSALSRAGHLQIAAMK